MYLIWIWFSNTVINRWAGEAPGLGLWSGHAAVILPDRSEDRDNHCFYEQHFITVTFGLNSICRCSRGPPLSVRTHKYNALFAIMCFLLYDTKAHQVEITVLEAEKWEKRHGLQMLSGTYIRHDQWGLFCTPLSAAVRELRHPHNRTKIHAEVMRKSMGNLSSFNYLMHNV